MAHGQATPDPVLNRHPGDVTVTKIAFLSTRNPFFTSLLKGFVVAPRRPDLSRRRPPATGLLVHYPDRISIGESTTASPDTGLWHLPRTHFRRFVVMNRQNAPRLDREVR